MKLLSKQQKKKTRRASARFAGQKRRLRSEQLEDRLVLSASSAGFVQPGGAGTDFFYKVVGQDGLIDLMTASTDISGDSNVSVTTLDPPNPSTTSTHSVSAGEIALFAAFFGGTYQGLCLDGLGGDDVIDASALTGDKVTVNGGFGDDDITGSPNQDRLVGNGGDDHIDGLAGNDVLLGGHGDDKLTGGIGADSMNGGTGDDILCADEFDTILRGGSGTDLLDFKDATAGVKVKLRDIEKVIGTPFDDVLDAGLSKVAITIDAGAGDDFIVSGSLADRVNGRSGWDTISYRNHLAGVTVELFHSSFNPAFPATSSDGDRVMKVENIQGSIHADTLSGDGGDNIIWGNSGKDVINGLGGDDALLGEHQADTLNGGPGDDLLFGGPGVDKLRGDSGNDTLVVDFLALDAAAGGAELFGGPGADIFAAINTQTEILPLVWVLDPAKAAAIASYIDDMDDAGVSDWDASTDTQDYDVSILVNGHLRSTLLDSCLGVVLLDLTC